MNKKIKFIPGWLDQGKNFPQFENVLEIWKENIKPDVKLDCDVIVAHSLGCNFLISNPENMKNKTVILVNPLAGKRSIFSWFWRWIKFRCHEKRIKGCKYTLGPVRVSRGLYYYFKLLLRDLFSTLENENSNIIAIRGKRDYYFCDEESCQLLADKNIKVVEIDEVGHLWNEKIDEEIKKIIGE